MKFLGLTVLLCLAAGSLAGEERKYDDTQTITEESTELYKLSWLQKAGEAVYGEGKGKRIFPPIEGALNLILTGVIDNVRGVAAGLEPGVQAVYATPIPTLRIILAGAKIRICDPKTHFEMLLNHVVCFVNGPLQKGLAVTPIPVCVKSEVQCFGPFMRLADTLTMESILADSWEGAGWSGSGVQDIQLQRIGNDGVPEIVQHIDGKVKTEVHTGSDINEFEDEGDNEVDFDHEGRGGGHGGHGGHGDDKEHHGGEDKEHHGGEDKEHHGGEDKEHHGGEKEHAGGDRRNPSSGVGGKH